MNTTQRTSVMPRSPSRLRRAALLFIIHASSLILSPLLLAATNDLSAALQKGLFEEEANRNLDAAIAAYQSLATQFDQDRKLAGTAVFRLGECYRKLGRTNEAVVQYQRVLRDFSDQAPLVTLSRQDLGALGVPPAGASAGGTAAAAVSEEASLLAAQLAGLDKLKNDPEERARAVLALFPDDELKQMLQNLVMLREQEAKAKTDPNAKLDEVRTPFVADSQLRGYLQSYDGTNSTTLGFAREQLRRQLALIAKHVDFIVGNQKARLQVLQAAAGPAASPETANSTTAAAGPDAEQREIQRIQTLLAQSPDLINAPGKNGETLLQAAAGKGQLEVVQFLLDHGAAVNGIAQPGLTPLHFAAGNGHLAVVDLLLRRGAKPDRATADAITPLHLAVLRGYAQVAKALIDAGAPVNARISPTPQTNIPEDLNNVGLRFGSTPLELAIENGYRGIAELLVAAKADLNGHVPFGNPPLINAVAASQKDMVELLLDHGADVNAADSNGNTALHRAAQNGSPELVSLLLAHKADVNAKDKAGNTPLHLAAANGNVAVIKTLAAAKAEVNAQNNDGETPLLLAVKNRKREAAEALLAAGADANLTGLDGYGRRPSPLLYAVINRDQTLARDLLEHGAKPNLEAATTPAHTVNESGPYTYLVEAATPIDLACRAGYADIVKLLLEHGADPNERRGDQQTPLLSLVVDKPEILRLLLDHKADVKLVNKWRETALTRAVSVGNTNSVALLVEHGAEVNARDGLGNTPLHLAVTERDWALTEYLLNHGADPNLLNNAGQTPLDLTKTRPPGPQMAGLPPLGFPTPGMPGVSLPPPRPRASLEELAALLRQHGAQDWVPRPGQITVTRRSTGTTYTVVRQGTNALNHFTLFELIAALPWGVNSPVPFPDFSKVTITRRDAKTGKLLSIPVDAAALVASEDPAKDVLLEWGDLVDIPDREHKLNEQWRGLPGDSAWSFAKCLERKVTVEVKGQTQDLKLAPTYGGGPVTDRDRSGFANGGTIDRLGLPFRLKDVLTGSARLLSTSDLTRVTVRRVDATTGPPREWVFNEQTVDPDNDLWVRGGDVIAVPEKP